MSYPSRMINDSEGRPEMIDEQISHTPIGREFMWDRLSDVDVSLLRNNRESSMRVINNPDQFPNADFDACRTLVLEIDAFMAQYGPLLSQFA